MGTADSDEVARVYRYEVARGFRDDVAHLSDFDLARGPGVLAGRFSGIGRAAWSIWNRGLNLLFSAAVAVGMWATAWRCPSAAACPQRRGLRPFGGLPGSSQALAGEVEPLGIVDEAIEHGVGVGGISNEHMPLVHGELADDDGGTMTVAIFEDFQES